MAATGCRWMSWGSKKPSSMRWPALHPFRSAAILCPWRKALDRRLPAHVIRRAVRRAGSEETKATRVDFCTDCVAAERDASV